MRGMRGIPTDRAETAHDKIVKLRYRLKHNKALRFISLPGKNLGYLIADKTYFGSKDSNDMRMFKGVMQGERCFIVGNGPSLRAEDLDCIAGEYAFGANRIYKTFTSTTWRPTFYCAFDPEFISQEWETVATLDLPHLFIARTPASLRNLQGLDNLTFINCHQSKFGLSKHTTVGIEFSEDPSRVLGMGYTVTFVALQLALWMGFKDIYLLGMDHRYSTVIEGGGSVVVDRTVKDHFFRDDERASLGTSYLDGMELAYRLAKEAAERRGAHIYNATRGGQLEVFERVDLDDLLASVESENQRS